ncbi:shikimate dehydrogenase [Roseovarius sp. A-2]|uniref:shikimate dehydrogenase family protein n=1 Tax=Roseovarius sp. A-2 TaxID=1570360 RepID=UPI0009B57283|nr:shikimate dehydrogenase [Roseovarius sp. A-2]GAW33534.1 shikimate dehydrogenase [Roseovarius sp. A-2]
MTTITGHTRVYGILADPIHHVKTPQVFHALARDEGIDAILVPFHARPEGVARLMDGLRAAENFGGFIATVPHKTTMLNLCDTVTEEAAQVGAVNCVRREADGRMVGAMLDGIGFVEGLRGAGIAPEGMRSYVAGAGGAASAVAFALAGAGVKSLTVTNRTRSKAEALCTRIAQTYPNLTLSTDPLDLAEQDLIMNATSLGMKPDDAMPLDTSQLHTGQVVAEAIMDPEMTPLLKAAKAAGCRIHTGLPMLQNQIRLMAQHMGAL